MAMAPVLLLQLAITGPTGIRPAASEAARTGRAAWRHGHFAAKSAPQHRDFAAGKVEANQ